MRLLNWMVKTCAGGAYAYMTILVMEEDDPGHGLGQDHDRGHLFLGKFAAFVVPCHRICFLLCFNVDLRPNNE